jgi:hypothetical protein
VSEVIGTAKAALWLNMSEETIRRYCREGKLSGAYQPGGYGGMWLVPVATLEATKACPVWLMPDLTEVA